jgi:hypothetical protein
MRSRVLPDVGYGTKKLIKHTHIIYQKIEKNQGILTMLFMISDAPTVQPQSACFLEECLVKISHQIK